MVQKDADERNCKVQLIDSWYTQNHLSRGRSSQVFCYIETLNFSLKELVNFPIITYNNLPYLISYKWYTLRIGLGLYTRKGPHFPSQYKSYVIL